MIRFVALAMVLLAPNAAAAADPRIRSLVYDPDAVVRIEGKLATAVQVVLAEGEEILHVAMGDSTAWEAAPEGRQLFLKPLEPKATNLIVAARAPDGAARTYAFDLRVSRAEGPWMVRFSYPADEKAKVATLIDAKEAALRQMLVRLRLERGAVEGPRNLAWTLQGDGALAPSEVSDNGRFTVLRFPGAQTIPAAFSVNADGEESLVAYDVRGEFLVIHGVHEQLRLRQGRQVLCLWNEAYQPMQGGSPSLTAASEVRRTDQAASR